MATIALVPHNERRGTWILFWVERGEAIGRVVEQEDGYFGILPQGTHWSPMKSFAAGHFVSPEAALAEVNRYFERR